MARLVLPRGLLLGTLELVLLAGCNPDLGLDGELAIACSSDGGSGCPGGMRCATAIGLCVRGTSPEAPDLLSASAPYATTVEVVFNHQMHAASLVETAAYSITPQLDVLDVEASVDGRSVTLVTAPQAGGRTYGLRVSGVYDAFGTLLESSQVASFVGFGPAADTLTPTLLAPASPAYFIGVSEIDLEWASRFGAHWYEVEVARDPDFQDQAQSPLRVIEPKTRVTVTLASGETYFWRVRADTSDEGTWSTGSFALLEGELFVGCPAAKACAAEPDLALGGRSAPLAQLQSAIELASALGLTHIRMAGRGGGAVYDERVLLVGGGLEIEGGFDSSFLTQDPAVTPTVIYNRDCPMVLAAIRAPTLLHHLSFVSEQSVAVAIGGASEALVLEDCQLESRSQSDPGRALEVSDSDAPGPVVRDSAITLTGHPAAGFGVLVGSGALQLLGNQISIATTSNYDNTGNGIYAAGGGDLLIRGNQISLAGSVNATGIRIDSTTALIEGNQIAFGAGSSYARGIDIINGGSATLRANRIHVHGAREVDIGVSTAGSSGYDPGGDIVAVNNAVTVSGSAYCLGMEVDVPPASARMALLAHNTVVTQAIDDGGPFPPIGRPLLRAGDEVVVNNIFACASEGVAAVQTGDLHTGSFQNNVMAGCATLYDDQGAAVLDAAALNGLDGTSGTACETSRFAGNAATALGLAQLFADPDGPTTDYARAEEGDLRLLLATDSEGIASLGRDTFAIDCGACGALVACGEVAVDAAEQTRTAPVSPGAFEKDAR